MNTLRTAVRVRALPLSRGGVHALRALERYDLVVFTSASARRVFDETRKKYGIKAPLPGQILRVGPRADLLKFPLRGKRVLFPRSRAAPYDIVRQMRARGAVVRPLPLYTVHPRPLSAAQKKAIVRGAVSRVYFRSASGVRGFMSQVRGRVRSRALAAHAQCIGRETARAAREAGFKKVSIVGIL